MKLAILLSGLMWIAACGAVTSSPTGTGAAAASAVAAPAFARSAASRPGTGASAAQAACPGGAASASMGTQRTSKARHTIMDGDPCADPHSPFGGR